MPSPDKKPLKLKRIRLKNIRCFDDIDVKLDEGGLPRSWALIFGDNGVGKTTFLRSIAIGLCDESSAAGLLREVYGEWNRTEDGILQEAEIRLDFQSAEGPAWIRTKILPDPSGYSRVSQTFNFAGNKTAFPWDRIFACGYGSARRAFGSSDIDDYATIDALYTLFNYDMPLQNPELVLRRLEGARSAQKVRKEARIQPLLDAIAAVLMLEPESIELTTRGLVIRGPWGPFQPIGGLGDGFQATLAWMCDLIGWALMYDEQRRLEEIEGIVLIDEIEQHLHPRWQREIVKLLSDHFPGIQFIATTHTPMCAIGATQLPDGSCELLKLVREGLAVRVRENLEVPHGKRVDQVLTSILFDLPTAGDNQTQYDIALFNRLAIKSEAERDEAERLEFERLRETLAARVGSATTDLEEFVRREVQAALEKHQRQSINAIAADHEALRQLRELIG